MPRAMIITPPKPCEHCGAMMERPARMPMSLWAKRRWCDLICMGSARAPKQHTCARCKETFTPVATRKRGHKFCSIDCANSGKAIKGPYRKVRDGQKVRALHRVVKEKQIDRPLSKDEIVHHSDENKLNNSPSNLELTTNAEHSREHMKGNQHARRHHR